MSAAPPVRYRQVRQLLRVGPRGRHRLDGRTVGVADRGLNRLLPLLVAGGLRVAVLVLDVQ
ncbi:hypothetical protein [Haloarcula marina]|uniref:hypothetical protein n=1 Tax=Haloarcula marina TaxID=2961574 RepID=UPI0020B7754F|nr:hypothetical protein [Halomicroarcula marina]